MPTNPFAVLDSDEEEFTQVTNRKADKKAKKASKQASTGNVAAAAPASDNVPMRDDRHKTNRTRGGNRGGRGRGGRQVRDGKREYDRHSGDVRKPVKRGGGGPRNWGNNKEQFADEVAGAEIAKELVEGAEGEVVEVEPEPQAKSFAEYQAELGDLRAGEGFESVETAQVTDKYEGTRLSHDFVPDERFQGAGKRKGKKKASRAAEGDADALARELLSFSVAATGADEEEFRGRGGRGRGGGRGGRGRGGGRGGGRGRGGSRGGRGGRGGARVAESDFPALGNS